MTRKELIRQNLFTEKEWDIIIIGGGSTGLGILTEAAFHGVNVLLLEQGDFASQTSSASTKLIHGGVRYLKDFSISHMIESAQEQQTIKRIAPHLVNSLPFMLPCSSYAQHLYYRAGFALFDAFTKSKKSKCTKSLNSKEMISAMPNFDNSKFSTALWYEDCQFDDARFAMSMSKTALQHGGVPLNYCRVYDFIKENGKIKGVLAEDQISGDRYVCKSKVVVNAAGPYIDSILSIDDKKDHNIILPTQGIHVVLPVEFIGGNTALIIPQTRKGKVLYAIPWLGKTLVGTTERVLKKSFFGNQIEMEDVEYLLSEVSPYLKNKPHLSDIKSVFSGIRPLIKPRGAENKRVLSRDHEVFVSDSHLVTIAGGKWTTYRIMAQDVLRQVADMGIVSYEDRKNEIVMSDYSDESCSEGRLKVYGASSTDIQELERHNVALAKTIHPNLQVTFAMIKYAISHEWAESADDVLSRRTKCLYIDAQSTKESLPAVLDFMAREMNKDDAWKSTQRESFMKRIEDCMPSPHYS